MGDKRDIIHLKLGKTPYNLWEWKGDVWVKEYPFGWYQCRVDYNKDTMTEHYDIQVFFGSKETYKRKLIKSKSLKTQN